MSDLVDESWRVRLGINEREDGGNIPGMLFASCPVPDPPGTSSKGDSDPASSSDDSSATPRYVHIEIFINTNNLKRQNIQRT